MLKCETHLIFVLQLENVVSCLSLLNSLGVAIEGVSASDVCEGNLKSILGLFFSLSRYKQKQRQQQQKHLHESAVATSANSKYERSFSLSLHFPLCHRQRRARPRPHKKRLLIIMRDSISCFRMPSPQTRKRSSGIPTPAQRNSNTSGNNYVLLRTLDLHSCARNSYSTLDNNYALLCSTSMGHL